MIPSLVRHVGFAFGYAFGTAYAVIATLVRRLR